MIDLIPSKDVREYIEKTDWKFTDFEKAAILYHLGLPFDRMCEELEKLAESTEDEALKTQIAERLAYERECRRMFKEDAEGYVYAVEVDEEDDYGPCINGYFADFSLAYAYGKKQGYKFEIQKYQIVGYNGAEGFHSKGYMNPYMTHREPENCVDDYEYDGHSVATWSFDREGNPTYFWSGEMDHRDEAENTRMQMCEFDPSRFESAFVRQPNPFEAGDIVRDTSNGTHGIVATSQEEWEKFHERIKNNGLYVDFSDESLVVDFLHDGGYISHGHVSPLFLEKYEPADGDPDKDLLLAGGGVLQGKCSLDWFTDCYDDYKDYVRKKNERSKWRSFSMWSRWKQLKLSAGEELDQMWFGRSFAAQMVEIEGEIEHAVRDAGHLEQIRSNPDYVGEPQAIQRLFGIIKRDPKNADRLEEINRAEREAFAFLTGEPDAPSSEKMLAYWGQYMQDYIRELQDGK